MIFQDQSGHEGCLLLLGWSLFLGLKHTCTQYACTAHECHIQQKYFFVVEMIHCVPHVASLGSRECSPQRGYLACDPSWYFWSLWGWGIEAILQFKFRNPASLQCYFFSFMCQFREASTCLYHFVVCSFFFSCQNVVKWPPLVGLFEAEAAA